MEVFRFVEERYNGNFKGRLTFFHLDPKEVLAHDFLDSKLSRPIQVFGKAYLGGDYRATLNFKPGEKVGASGIGDLPVLRRIGQIHGWSEDIVMEPSTMMFTVPERVNHRFLHRVCETLIARGLKVNAEIGYEGLTYDDLKRITYPRKRVRVETI